MKTILSYIFPVTRKIQSDFNGIIEVTWNNGRKVLDSEHANYSYGSLQRILKFALKKIDMRKPANALLLGLGGGSVIQTLRDEFDFHHKITAIDIDPVVIAIAESEFGIKPDKNLEIVAMDAAAFVQRTPASFDLIIVDLFIDNLVPEKFYSAEFWATITQITATHGYVIFNAAVSQASLPMLNRLTEFLKKSFSIAQYKLIEGTNTLLIGQKLD